MKARRLIITQIVFVLSLFLISSIFVQAETTECTAITYLPYPITTQGIYCLTSDLSTNMTSGNAIEIDTNNVVIDLNGHKIGGLSAGPGTTATGIYAYQRQNITLRNGTIRGFYEGIWLSDSSPYTTSQGHLIENIRVDMNTFRAMEVRGLGNIIRNNQVVNTGGSTATAGGVGIFVLGPGARVINNDVMETHALQNGWVQGIYTIASPGAVVANNRVGNSSLTGTSVGIFIDLSADVLISNNCLTKMSWGVQYAGTSTGKYRDNLTSGCTTPFTGGTDVGGNN
jgi:hypothetical protein